MAVKRICGVSFPFLRLRRKPAAFDRFLWVGTPPATSRAYVSFPFFGLRPKPAARTRNGAS
jgi:hypothetical protein